jgi:4-aminobutyrate aminotransferase
MSHSNNFASRGDAVLSPVLAHYTRINIASGKGSYLYDVNDREYLDFTAGIAVASTGHCHPDVVEAIQKQAETLIHACAGVVYYGPNVELAERLGGLLDYNLKSCFFTQSGTEAIEACLKMAKYVTKKYKVLAFRGGFHGRTMGSLSTTSSKDKYRDGFGPMVEGVSFFPYPYAYRSPWESTPDTFDDVAVSQLEAHFDTLGDDYAAAIIEPIMGEGGYVPASSAFLKALRRLCSQKGMLLIFDEIQTGMGRTGDWFNFHHHDVIPDIIALAKGIASGLPLGACISTPELMAKFSPGAHGGTYGGNPVCCQAAIATIDVLTGCIHDIPRKSQLAFSQLRHQLDGHPNVGDIRGQGLMIGVEVVKELGTKDPAPELTQRIMTMAAEQGLLIVSCGIYGNVLRIMPPLTISDEELASGLSILVSVFDECRS